MDKRKKKAPGLRARIFFAVLGLLGLTALLILFDSRSIGGELYGEESMKLEFGSRFSDPGCAFFSYGRIFGRGKELPYEVSGSVDCRTTGEYEITYTAEYKGESLSIKRSVAVEDSSPPDISLGSVPGYNPDWSEGYSEEGYSAYDLRDGDLTDKVRVEEKDGELIYTVTDSSGNTASVRRKCSYTDSAPRLSLLGEEHIVMTACPVFSDPGFEAIDALGNDRSDIISVSGQVLPYRPGEYELIYYAENAAGVRVEKRRSVTVNPAKMPLMAEPEEKTIYLTFDDGPGPFTGELLDLLKEYNVKASFFVTCAKPEYFDLIGRAYSEGHAIGAHSASHKYYVIYSTAEEYFKDLAQVEELIYAQTGAYSPLVRFPGGSKTLRALNRPLFAYVDECMDAMGCRYFDWNVSASDAGAAAGSTSAIIDNVIWGCSGEKWCVVLQHDTNGYSVAAVENIITWGLENGWSFKALDMTVPEVHSVNPEKYS